ncbi:MAG: hypothetical protein CMB80_02480, partial [Flammeovirgaceae bacterium]|nr:hypothetical protein [Flammeovirgaceae bacterium]
MAKCEDILEAHFGKDFPKEAKKIADAVDQRISRGDDYTEILKEINQDVIDGNFRTQIAATGFVKKAFTKQNMMDKVFGGGSKSSDWVKNFKAFLTGSTRKRKGFLNSVGTMQRAKFKTLSGKIFASLEMTPAGIRRMLHSKSFQNDLVKELYEGAGSSNNIHAQKVAKAVQEAKEKLIVELNASGVPIRFRTDHVTTQWHDPYKMVKAGDEAREKWIKDTRGLLDWEKTLSEERAITRSIDAGNLTIDDYLGRVYDQRTMITKQYDSSKLRRSGELSEEMSHSRKLIFKDSDSWIQYNKLYGHESPIHSIMNDLEIQSNRSVLMDYMGPNPHEAFESMIDNINARFKAEGKSLGALDENGLRSRFAQITGEAFIIGKPGMAKFVNIITGINVLSKLGKAALSSITDVSTAAMTMSHMGENGLTAYGKLAKNIATTVPEAERNYVYRMLGVGVDGILGSSASRFTIDDAVPGIMSRMVDNFFHINGLNAWTDWAREGFSKMASMRMASQLRKGWDSIDTRFKTVLEQYDINQKDWDALRKVGSFRISDLVKKNPGMKGTTFPNERFITGDWVLQQGGPSHSRLADKVNLFFVNESRIGVPDIGAGERALMMRTFQRGTLPGAVAQSFWQFRSYQVAVLSNLLPRFGHMGVPNMAIHTVGTLGMGYLSITLKDLAKGLTPRSVFKKETWADSLRQSGILGFAGDYIASEYGSYHSRLDEEILGPVYSQG